jgi:hypothetical protein
VSRSPEQSQGEATPVLSEVEGKAEGKNLVLANKLFSMQRTRFPSAWLRAGFASAEFILNEVKGFGSE